MAEFADQPFHIRSNSMPSTSHPTVGRVEDEQRKLRTHLPSSSRTAQMLFSGLRGIGDLYELIEELLRLPSTQQSLHPTDRKCVEEQLDDSLKILDLIGAVRDCMVAMREHVQDLRSALRRNGNTAVTSKKVQKLIKDCLKTLKAMEHKTVPCSVAKKDNYLLAKALGEARESTIFLLRSILLFLSKPKLKDSMWSFLPKANSKRRVACEGSANEEENADMWLQASYDCMSCKDVNAVQVQNAQIHLQSFEARIESLASGLDCLFRRLIQNRVSLLNLLAL